MRLAEVQRRVQKTQRMRNNPEIHALGRWVLYRDTLRALLDHDISDDARQIIEAALEAEK